MQINRDGFDVRLGLRGVAAILLDFLLGGLFGQSGVIIAVSALFISMLDFAGPLGERLKIVGGVYPSW